jgi:uncharacterized protein (UPF0335 family)
MGKQSGGDTLGLYLQRIADADERRSEEATIVTSIYREAASAGLHKAALRLILKLKSMESSKSAEFLRHFDQYRHECGLDQQPDMFDEPGKQG